MYEMARGAREQKLKNKRLLCVIGVVLVVAIGGSVAWAMTWSESQITMTARSANFTSQCLRDGELPSRSSFVLGSQFLLSCEIMG
jgi:hypothetical protein